jgi:23S rRNA G2069 N7-methylase RlmK/C1962 C5-methylase RlmI
LFSYDERTTPTTIIWKTTPSRLKQDGLEMDEQKDDEANQQLLDPVSDPTSSVIATENGIRYHTYPYSDGQKTGVYCDQRENRWNLAQLCRGKRVLDLCCYHGGFSLNAILNGGALCSTGVDSSEDAILTCQRNAQLNGCTESQLKFIQSDITSFLQDTAASDQGIVYDVIVLDPPKLAPSVNGLDKARRKYHAFNRDAIKLIAPEGGLLLTCTCSAAMTQKDGGRYFLEMAQGAALAVGREVTLLRVSGAASCHTQSPISWPAGAYLTAALFYVHPSPTTLYRIDDVAPV